MTENQENIDWEDEANAVIRDVRHHVQNISISKLPRTKMKIYFNLTTFEKKDFCVELTAAGFRIVGEKYDSDDKEGKYSFYETPYSMLDHLSPAYRDSFREELFQKLNRLQDEQERELEDEEQEVENATTNKEEDR